MIMTKRSLEQVLFLVATTITSCVFGWVLPSSLVRNHRNGYRDVWSRHQVTTTPTESPVDLQINTNKDEIFPYDWKQQWYALTYASYIPNPSKSSEITPAAVFGEPLVLWREDDDGEIFCAADSCPHRQAALSEGRLRNGQLYCYYHGWEFSGKESGACTRIPQLEAGATIPKRACLQMKTLKVEEGVVWVWMDDETPPKQGPPVSGILDENGRQEGWNVYDFQIDLPYDHSFLIENLADPAHIDISHDRTQGGGKRERARPYDMKLLSISPDGFIGKVRQDEKLPYSDFVFEAPGIIRNKFQGTIGPNNVRFQSALHCMPLGPGRSRLLFRVFNKGLPWFPLLIMNLRPKWARHLNSCKVLEQDVGLIATQEDYYARQNKNLKDDYLLLQSSDRYVQAYRQWLDKVGHGMPWYQGLFSHKGGVAQSVPPNTLPPALKPGYHRASNEGVVETRYHRHVMNCPASRNALRRIQLGNRISTALTILAASVLCGLAGVGGYAKETTVVTKVAGWAVRVARIILPTSALATACLRSLENKFFVSFKRKDQVRGESGLIP